ncbi:hypothetical protein E4T39_04585 [Aureobasidium subglaciale]|nr:hypothetical protein E4T39_04585 [Aureobasidium subglaciale]
MWVASPDRRAWGCLFPYTGTKVVSVAFGEAPDPRKKVPKAVNQTLSRIGFFYALGALALRMSVAYNSPQLVGAMKAQSSAGAGRSHYLTYSITADIRVAALPFVLPDLVNAPLLVFVLSAAISDEHVPSISQYSLTAPRIFANTTAKGAPNYGVAISSAFILLSYMNVSRSSSTVLNSFISLVTVLRTTNWISLLVPYIRMRRRTDKQGIPLTKLPRRDPSQPYGAHFALFMTCLISVFNDKEAAPILGYTASMHTFDIAKCVTSYNGVLVYVVNFVAWKVFT